jgi:23S rRNA pseudouridine1911/1915/1917 synthase
MKVIPCVSRTLFLFETALHRRSQVTGFPHSVRSKIRGALRLASSVPPFELATTSRYLIVGSHAVKSDAATILPALVDLFSFPSSADARKACRQGEIVILRASSKVELCDRISPLNKSYFVDDVDELFVDRTILAVDPWTFVFQEDLVARIARVPGCLCYPVELTGYIQPPDVLAQQQLFPGELVVYEDDDIAVVNKPAGLATVGVERQDLQSALPFVLYPPRTVTTITETLPRTVHPLDRDASGLVVVAKTTQGMQQLSQAVENGCVHETYTALVFGKLHGESGTINSSLNKAVANWRVLQPGALLSMIEVKPKPESSHRIRQYLSYSIGGNEYSSGSYQENDELGLFLCRNSVTFEHPTTGRKITISISIPSSFYELLARKGYILPFRHLNETEAKTQSPKSYVERIKAELGQQFTTDEGRQCAGEPSVDPSRMVNPNKGDSEWFDEY